MSPSPGVLLAIHASSQGLGLICSAAQGPEAAWAGELEVIGAPHLIALMNHLRGGPALSPPRPGGAEPPGAGPSLNQVKGQETAKRALEIAASGGHNLLRVVRTIADLAGSDPVGRVHLAEALSYRRQMPHN